LKSASSHTVVAMLDVAPANDPVDLTDSELIARCAASVDVPKASPPDSFVLHAPLEVLARSILLPRVPERGRAAARARLQWVADTYEAAGPRQVEVAPLEPIDLTAMVLSLAAAGHAPILWSLRSRVAEVDASFGCRLIATDLRRYPDWTLQWPSERDASGIPAGDLVASLCSPRSPGDPGSDFIYPTMHLVDESGLAAEVLDGPLRSMTVERARRDLLRLAAQSMLQDNPAAAPYGWTHCLTMPQAVLRCVEVGVDPDVAIGVAALYVLGFRSTQGQLALDPQWRPDPASAAGKVWFAVDGDLAPLVDELVATGAAHEDAHVAKYTLACLDAAVDDPDAERLFLSALAHLQEWWR
jgi:hypothetical protein